MDELGELLGVLIETRACVLLPVLVGGPNVVHDFWSGRLGLSDGV